MNCNENEAKFQLMLDSMAEKFVDIQEFIACVFGKLPIGVLVKDVEDGFKYIYWNQFVEKCIGRTGSGIGMENNQCLDYDMLIFGKDQKKEDRKVIASGKEVKSSSKIQITTDELRNVKISKFPITLKDGKLLLLVLLEDITEVVALNKTIERKNMLAEAVLHTNDIWTAILHINPNSKTNYDDSIVCLNSWNKPEDKAIKVPWNVYILTAHPEDRGVLERGLRRLCSGEIIEDRVEVRLRRIYDEDYSWYEVYASISERDKAGRPAVLLGTTTNIQERKKQEKSLEEAKDKAELADKMKSKYLADMSHEIRTPLTAITGFAELMAFADSDEERLSYYEIIKTNNQMLMQLINDILDLSKIEADVVKIDYEEVDINDIVDTAYASARLRVSSDVKLSVEKDLEQCLFRTDPVRLLQIVTNLTNNAIKHTPTGSITIGYTEVEKGLLRFHVRDTGLGISKEKQANLFDRFAKMNDYAEGIGLGLAICQGLVKKMGGVMSVTSELGVGSEFFFTLPSHTGSN